MTSSTRTAWIDCSNGVSGDMLIGAFTDLGVQLADVVAALGVGASLETSTTDRNGQRAVAVNVSAADDQPLRTLADLVRIIDNVRLPATVAEHARNVLQRLATAEARVHNTSVDAVHFHEIGAVDTIVDVVGVCYAVHSLDVDEVVVSPVALGGGSVDTAHGTLPVPGPAVMELLAGSRLTAYGGPVDVELATPTGVALLAELATRTGAMPAMRLTGVGVGAGSRLIEGRANIVRVAVGSDDSVAGDDGDWLLLEANVDDLDPRLWPEILEQLFAAGAVDAWLTPILMKKGRPAHTLSALTSTTTVDAVRTAMFRESSTIGVRMTTVTKSALDREWVTVDVHGEQVRVKVARLRGEVVNLAPEWVDVITAAKKLERPAKEILAFAAAAAERNLG